MSIFTYILLHNILPIIFIISLGFLLGKKFNLDINPLTKLNFYIYVPFFVFIQIYSTKMPSDVYKILIFAALLAVLNQFAASTIAKLRGYNKPLKNAFVNSIMFYNSGNIGIPLITLVFSSFPYLINGKTPYLTIALTTQIIILVVQNISTNTIGFFNAGKGNMHWLDSVKSILHMPTIYAVPLAFILKLMPYRLEDFPLWSAFIYLKDGLISIALITLGVQLSRTKFSFSNKDVYISNFVRLIGGAFFAFMLIKVLGIRGIPAQALMISSALPTAVNTALIAVERNNEPDFACQAVMTATIFSSISLVFVIYVARLIFPI
jgi:predicted permease